VRAGRWGRERRQATSARREDCISDCNLTSNGGTTEFGIYNLKS
jgi:hypothetical protein